MEPNKSLSKQPKVLLFDMGGVCVSLLRGGGYISPV